MTSSTFYFSKIRIIRVTLLLGIALNLVMIGIRVSHSRPLLSMHGGLTSVVEPAALLVVYAVLVVWATRRGAPVTEAVLKGSTIGLIGGGIEVVHITVENFTGLSAHAETISTGAFMLGMFLVWSIAGFRAARYTGSVGTGLLAGCWSAMVGMLITATFGLMLLNTFLPRLEMKNIGSPDLIRSGWTDLRAFTIADLFEAVVKVLLVGPILGMIFGGLGGILARMFSRNRGRTAA